MAMLLRDAHRIVKDGNYKAGYASKRRMTKANTLTAAEARIKKHDDWKKQQKKFRQEDHAALMYECLCGSIYRRP